MTGIARTTSSNIDSLVFDLSRTDGSHVQGPVRMVERVGPSTRFDVLWIATKAHDLDKALERFDSEAGAVIPLLNGVEHVTRLRRRFGDVSVLPATIAVEAERISLGEVRQNSPFVRLVLAARARSVVSELVAILENRAVSVEFESDEVALLWNKLVFLAPFALATAASGLAAGAIRADAHWRRIFADLAEEVASVAQGMGANSSAQRALAMLDGVAPGMTSSLFRDLKSRRTPEIDAIAGDPIRAAEQLGIKVPTLRRIRAEIGSRSSTRSIPRKQL